MIISTGAFVRLLGLALGLLFVAHPLSAADPYPTRTIRWVVPWPAGGVADTQARIIAEQLGRALGQQVMVDNRAGASGVLGADIVAKAKPDGYTLLYVSPNEQAIAQAIGMKVGYTAEKDFAPITQFLRRPTVLVVNPSLNVRTVIELVALVKARAGTMSYGTPGVAHFNHFVTEVFNRKVGIKVPAVPYKGEAPMITDLIGGQVDYGFGFATTVDPLVKAGRLRALATTGSSRSPQLPDVSTFIELGMPELEMTIWTGMVGPAGLRPDIVERLQSELSKILRSPAITSRREFADSEIIASKPEEFREFLAAERLRWPKLVKETGITVE
ncbi:MAG TPA: tripartite tricarboxylate transporter substrate binding protein [Burkholderiales bacterium]|nr:tripartite tricarboxylate transporter substrate binding protein [Burkholderiales bacterium]